MYIYGFTNKSLRLIKSILQTIGREQKSIKVLAVGLDLLLRVPQGSVLGPLLFNIDLNDLFHYTEYIIMCAVMQTALPFIKDVKELSWMSHRVIRF